MIIFCSKKAETFLGRKVISPNTEEVQSSFLGDWNLQAFTVERQRCLLFMNNKTCYSVVMKNVLKGNVPDFALAFRSG